MGQWQLGLQLNFIRGVKGIIEKENSVTQTVQGANRIDNGNEGIGEADMGKSCRRHGHDGGEEQEVRRVIFVTEQRAFSE